MGRVTLNMPAPPAPGEDRSRAPGARRRKVHRLAVLAVVIVSGVALAGTSLVGHPEIEPVGTGPTAEHGRVQPVDDVYGNPIDVHGSPANPPNPRACLWTSKVDVPFLPREDIGGPPTPESFLIFEGCNGELTGDIAWYAGDLDTAPTRLDPVADPGG